nr:F-box protein At1g67340-like [Ipomoea trifida]
MAEICCGVRRHLSRVEEFSGHLEEESGDLEDQFRCRSNFVVVLGSWCNYKTGWGVERLALGLGCLLLLFPFAFRRHILFYCYRNQGSSASLMAKAAINSHAPASYSLAVMHFNDSGGSKTDKDLRAAVALCARAASVGHVDTLREMGHCFQDGYGVKRNVPEGRRFMVQANVREVANV